MWILRHFKWHFLLCFANWTEEARVKQRVEYGFSSLLLALEIYLPLRALELGNAGTAIDMDTRNTEDLYPLSGQRLWCDLFVKLLRRLPVLWQQNCYDNRFKGLTLRFDSRHATFNDSCASHCSLWSNVRENMCYCREGSIADSRRQARTYKQWAGAWSILDILLGNANSSNFAYDGYVRCRLLLTYLG